MEEKDQRDVDDMIYVDEWRGSERGGRGGAAAGEVFPKMSFRGAQRRGNPFFP